MRILANGIGLLVWIYMVIAALYDSSKPATSGDVFVAAVAVVVMVVASRSWEGLK